ncbi:MAG: DUF4136 domain-containing protein [Flavobacteriaceae bacterium]|nr:DUF4136 domain-containing protein [Flavobacteriaceae bacterium]
MRLINIFCILLLVTSCATIEVKYDYDTKYDFSNCKTYNYYSDIETGLSVFDEKRLISELNRQLNAQGFSLSDTPDFYIDIRSNQYEEVRRSSVGIGAGTGGGNVVGGVSVGFPLGAPKMNRRISIDFHDEDSVGLFWQAVVKSSYNSKASTEKREANIKAIVAKLLEDFPPQKR